MISLRIMILCIAAALICASLRSAHPQIASAVALAAGVCALIASSQDIGAFSKAAQELEKLTAASGSNQMYLMKVCGLAMVAELSSDICRDAGEAALAHRIDAAVKIGIAASALPAAARIMERIAELMT